MLVYQRVEFCPWETQVWWLQGSIGEDVRKSIRTNQSKLQCINVNCVVISYGKREYYLNGGYCKRLKQLGYQNRKEKLEKLRMMKIFLDQHGVLVWTTRNKSRWFRHFLGPCFNQSTWTSLRHFFPISSFRKAAGETTGRRKSQNGRAGGVAKFGASLEFFSKTSPSLMEKWYPPGKCHISHLGNGKIIFKMP